LSDERQYVADKNEAVAYYPHEPKVRADIHRWHLWEAAHWFPSCYVYLAALVKPMLKGEPDRAAIEKEAPNWHKLANILDQRLANQRWLCGDKVTLADIAVAAPMHLRAYQKLPLDAHRNLRRSMTEGIEELPCWKATEPKVSPRSTRLLMGAAPAPTGPPGASTLTKGQERPRSVCRGPCQFQGSARVLWRPCCKHGDVAMAVGAAHRGYPARGNKPRRQVQLVQSAVSVPSPRSKLSMVATPRAS
jgi:hypothetical protein